MDNSSDVQTNGEGVSVNQQADGQTDEPRYVQTCQFTNRHFYEWTR